MRTRPNMSPRRPNGTTSTARHHQVAHQHPQQVADVAGRQRVQADAAEDGGQRDQHDRRVDGGQQRAQGGVGQHDPLVEGVVVDPSAPPAAGGLGKCRRPRSATTGVSSSRSQSSSVLLRYRIPHVNRASPCARKTHILAIQSHVASNSYSPRCRQTLEACASLAYCPHTGAHTQCAERTAGAVDRTNLTG